MNEAKEKYPVLVQMVQTILFRLLGMQRETDCIDLAKTAGGFVAKETVARVGGKF